jgi:Putative metallopeptidase
MRHVAIVVAALALCCATASYALSAETDAPQVRIGYGGLKGNAPAIADARDLLVRYKTLEEMQVFLSPLRMPVDLTIRAEQCGALRREYDPRTRTVTICYETIAQILKVVAQHEDASDDVKRETISGTIVQALFHEIAYGLFDVFDVPVWGRIDDAADRLSAFIMTQFGIDSASLTVLGTARFFDWSARTWTGKDFASMQSPEAQRFYNFLCIAVGSDVADFYTVASQSMPKDRLERCLDSTTSEYLEVRKAFDLRLMPFVDPNLLIKARARNW